MSNKKNVYIASDHAGYELKEKLIAFLRGTDYCTVTDLGPDSINSVDYPDFAKKVLELMDSDSWGILICGSGIGMSMVANRDRRIRAALCRTVEDARLSRQHNNANVLCLGARVTAHLTAAKIMATWLTTPFSGEERHQRRIDKLS